jgi:hypothetical protein
LFIILFFNAWEGVPNREISERLNLSEKAIEYHLTKSLKVLRLVLKDLTTTFHHSGGNHLNDGTTNLRGINGQE